MGDQHIRILLDSRSSHTFISPAVAAQYGSVKPLSSPLKVQIANGQLLLCTSHIPAAHWSLQQCQFTSDLKILPLSSYDMILGLDWLETQSPMEIHWAQKWIQLQYHGQPVQLVGILLELPAGAVLHVCSAEPEQDSDQSSWPPEIQELISHYSTMFEPPNQLPPSRSCDHSIPLIPRASLVYSRPYRFSHTIKDEVEKQVRDMFQSGIIQKSSSPFSSPVLLVKKKDHSWRFCILTTTSLMLSL